MFNLKRPAAQLVEEMVEELGSVSNWFHYLTPREVFRSFDEYFSCC